MVLQQKANNGANLWGKAAPVEKSNGHHFVGQPQIHRQAAADSTWKTWPVATPAAGGPSSIRISDGEAIVLDNVMIGGSLDLLGQSNMQMPVMGLDSR